MKRLKAEYHQERRRNRSGEGGASKFMFFDEMNAVLGGRPMSNGRSSFSSINTSKEGTSASSMGRLHLTLIIVMLFLCVSIWCALCTYDL